MASYVSASVRPPESMVFLPGVRESSADPRGRAPCCPAAAHDRATTRQHAMLSSAGGDKSTKKRIFVRSVTNFVIGDEWFCSIFNLKMRDSSKMV